MGFQRVKVTYIYFKLVMTIYFIGCRRFCYNGRAIVQTINFWIILISKFRIGSIACGNLIKDGKITEKHCTTMGNQTLFIISEYSNVYSGLASDHVHQD